ncbi:hypothetical protein AB0L56_31070 [Streptomyces sp. NPDC052079]|uniref:hypothetical protein n=1 Tax=Streptomyces sp. NPDC052079 TaxID=3155526 RepID=UPI00343008E3
MSRFGFVEDCRDAFDVKRLCRVLDVNRSSYYKWRAGAGRPAWTVQSSRWPHDVRLRVHLHGGRPKASV